MYTSGLAIAWFLSWFGFDALFITGIYELFGIQITVAGYYTIFFLVSLVLEGIAIVYHRLMRISLLAKKQEVK